jgi:hypothetical protein
VSRYGAARRVAIIEEKLNLKRKRKRKRKNEKKN